MVTRLCNEVLQGDNYGLHVSFIRIAMFIFIATETSVSARFIFQIYFVLFPL